MELEQGLLRRIEVDSLVLILRPPEHRLLPFAAGLVEAQDVDVAVVVLDLELAIVSPCHWSGLRISSVNSA